MIHEERGVPSWYLAMRCHWFDSVRHPEASMRTLLARWVRWRLVKVSLMEDGTRYYFITQKGENWLYQHWPILSQALFHTWLPELDRNRDLMKHTARDYFDSFLKPVSAD
jgi:DNA-binding PadR family transcriptional regulator